MIENITIHELGTLYAYVSIEGGEIKTYRVRCNRRYGAEYIVIDGIELDIWEDMERSKDFIVDR